MHPTLPLPPHPDPYESLGSCTLSRKDEELKEVDVPRLRIDGVERDDEIIEMPSFPSTNVR
jgi:hypothetical protein